ncbi:leucine-rich repeat domain-containing protein [Acinetobacter sp.]|uniref:leucine-rich repeat domain-containing protein n=1 Tax=Acinetobacter sp. TaxID=472 RepID=UPI003BB0333C
MAIYTGVADANGDFTVHFSSNYTSGQKVTVTAEKDSATKSIELHAPSEAETPAGILFSGSMVDYPQNIGVVNLSGTVGVIPSYAFYRNFDSAIGAWATGLIIGNEVTAIGDGAFYYWSNIKNLTIGTSVISIGSDAFNSILEVLEIKLPNSVQTIGYMSFYGASKCKKVDIGSGILTIAALAFQNLDICEQLICRATIPPTIQSNTFQNLNATCVIKVPASSVAAYKAKANWKAFASRIQAI